jgi:hypothetical protein
MREKLVNVTSFVAWLCGQRRAEQKTAEAHTQLTVAGDSEALLPDTVWMAYSGSPEKPHSALLGCYATLRLAQHHHPGPVTENWVQRADVMGWQCWEKSFTYFSPGAQEIHLNVITLEQMPVNKA